MTVLKHPRIPNVEVDVPEPDVDRWASQGWVSPVVGYLVEDDGDGSHLAAWTDREATVVYESGQDEPLDPPKRPRKG